MKQTPCLRPSVVLLSLLLLTACNSAERNAASDRHHPVQFSETAAESPVAYPILAADSVEDHAAITMAAEPQAESAVTAHMASKSVARAAPPASSALYIVTPTPQIDTSGERYGKITDNPVKLVSEAPVSTFSIDVDTGSYSNIRRYLLTNGQLPPPDAVRVEEMINYFPYQYANPTDGKPFAVYTALSPAPWNAERVLMRVALKGQDLAKQTLPPVNLVFLVDVSGSMNEPDKLPLLQASLKLLSAQMRAQDRISLVTYAGSTSVVLSGTPGDQKNKVAAAISQLSSGGSTAGGAGIKLAYKQARANFIKGGINRILLATDGDFNVGITDFDQLKQMVEKERKSGVSFSTLGFGAGNYNEHLMEQLADAGNGAYSYIDSLQEGRKVLVNEMTSTLATIAKDVKVQVEFNPAQVKEYRLIGYENRMLKREDFNNDKIEAGDIGAGHTVTALYELTLIGQKGAVDPLRYQDGKAAANSASGSELAFVKLRYKNPNEEKSHLLQYPLMMSDLKPFAKADDDFRLATAVAGFGQLLRGTADLGTWEYQDAQALAADFEVARHSAQSDKVVYRTELVKLIKAADKLANRN